MRRLAETKWRKKKTAELRTQYAISRNEVHELIKTTKKQYCSRKIREAGLDMNTLNKLFKVLLGRNKQVILPEYDSDNNLSKNIDTYFDEKIENIYNSFDNQMYSACAFLRVSGRAK